MKKYIALFLLIISVMTLSACSGTSETIETIDIGDENFSRYFDIEVYVHDINETTTGSGIWTQYKDTCTLTISITPKKNLIVNGDLGVEFLVSPRFWFQDYPSSYFEKDSSGEYLTKYSNGKFSYIAKLELSSDGTAKANITCKAQEVVSKLNDMPTAEVYNVFGSGTITIK